MGRIADWLTVESRGERARVLAWLIVATGGAILCRVSVGRIDTGPVLPVVALGWYDLWILAAGVTGGLGGFYLVRESLGQTGPAGWTRAIFAALVLGFSGSVIAGTLVLPIYGTMFGPLVLAVTLIDLPVLAVAWTGSLVGVHLLMQRWREERESIFVPLPVARVKGSRGGGAGRLRG
ncbi:hypothetical protein [Histidinibacterium lentulum]|uniref:hypothetical protein n=1 Tax=Histidinibacterium lentulum TaxID=2480588 RepID=UPI00161476FB|nr:hypothetical protein [Histidinibacterium lentulum]